MEFLKRLLKAGIGGAFGFAVGTALTAIVGVALSATTNFSQIDLSDPYTDGQVWYGAERSVSVGGTAPTITAGTNNYYQQFTVADSTDTVVIPLDIPGRTSSGKGYKITSVKVVYSLSGTMTHSNGGITPELYKVTAPAHGDALTGALVTTTYDTAHDTYPERITSGSHTATLTISSAAFAGSGEGYFFKFAADGDGAATIKFWGAQVNYDVNPN